MMELAEAIARIRPAVRAGRAYHVGGPPRASVKLNQNESPFDLPDDLKRELIERYWREPFNRYPFVQPVALKRALALQVDWDPDGILVGNGSNELMSTVNHVLVSPGTAVVLPHPMFSFYTRLAVLYEAKLVAVPPRKDLSFDADAITNAVREHNAGLAVLTTPNSPTGLAMPLAEVRAVLESAPGFVLADEAYGEFSREESALSLLAEHPNLLLLRTFSKAFGLAGLRLGYLIGSPGVVSEIVKARVPFMVDRLSELAALALLERPGLIQERVAYLQRGTEWLFKALCGIPGVEALESQTNFVLFRSPMDSDALMKALVHHGVLVRSMSSYEGLAGYVRVNAGTEAENQIFVRALTKVLR